ncbi:MAG: nitroreductase family deazaflavin-dependent oxidoreductase [Chloroflexi bacterium]|nr:nitroreductase family deazaflavin-dependent oxidoreductase [Chloroflexota bacterium]
MSKVDFVSEKHGLPYPTGILGWALRLPLHLHRLGFGLVLSWFNLMILGTRGRSSGQARYVPVECRRHGSKIYVVSGWGEQPHWYRNLQADALATAQIGGRAYRVRAVPLTDRTEALRVLNMFRRTAPLVYDAVLARMSSSPVDARSLPDISHQFTIVRLNIEPGAPPVPPLPRDLGWLAPALALLFGLTLLALRVLRQRS